MEALNMNNPQQIVEANIKAQESRVKTPLARIILMGILAGMFIACGAAASSVAMHAVSNVGVSRFIGGIIFPVGLMMIVLIGGELFTGDCLIIMAILDKKAGVLKALKVLAVVYLSNLVGSIIFAFIVYKSGQYNYTDGLLGAYTIKVALGKVNLTFSQALCSGIICNIIVCLAVLMATAAKDVAGKVAAIFFPIMAFVVSGYEHSVANMYYISAGIIAKGNDAYINKAMDAYGYTKAQLDALNWKSFILDNLLPVTIGNIIGGMIFVGVILYLIHGRSIRQNSNATK